MKSSAIGAYTAFEPPGEFLCAPLAWRCSVCGSSSAGDSSDGLTHQKSTHDGIAAYTTACIPASTDGHAPATTSSGVPVAPVARSRTAGARPPAISSSSQRSQP